MPAVPYARAKYSVNGGALTSGGTIVPASATIQLSGESTVGWLNQLWEIYEYPTGFSVPSGWTNINGSYQSTAVTPPIINLPGATTWGKFLFRLTVNQGLLAGVYHGPTDPQPLVDIASAVGILSPKGLRDTAFGESNQFDAFRQWAGDMKFDWRTIDTLFQTGGGGVGQVAFTVDADSAAIVAGNVVTMAPGAATVTLATAAAVTAAGGVLGIATSSGTAGQTISVSVESMVPNSVTGLGAGTQSFVRVNTTTHNCERVASFSTSDSPVGTCNTAGDVLMIRGAVVGLAPTGTCGGTDVGGGYPSSLVVLKVNGASVPAAGALTAGNVPIVSGVAALTYGKLDLSNSNSVQNALPLGNQAGPTGTGVVVTSSSAVYAAATLPINGASGIAGTDGSSKVALANMHGAIIETGEAMNETYTTSDPTWNGNVDSFTTTSYVDSTKYKATVAAALQVGDVVEVYGRILVSVGATTEGTFHVVLLDGASSIVLPSCYWDVGGSVTALAVVLTARYVMTNAMSAGTCTVKFQGKRTSGTGTVNTLTTSELRYKVIRP